MELDPVADFTPPTGRGTGKRAEHFRWNCWRASPTISELSFFQCAFGSGDGRTGAAGDFPRPTRGRAAFANGDKVRVFNRREKSC